MNKNVRIAIQLKHKDDSINENSGSVSYGEYQWDNKRFLYHANGNNEWVMFKDDITDDIEHMIDNIIVTGQNKENLFDPSLVFLYQFDDSGNAYYSDQVNDKWKEWMKLNYTKTKPNLTYVFTDGLEIGVTPFLHEKCVMTTVRFDGDSVDYKSIGRLTEGLINRFITLENNVTFRVAQLYDKCMKIAHDLHLIDVNQDHKLTNVWSRYSEASGVLDEVSNWIPTIDFYQDAPKTYELDLSRMDKNYWYRYNLTDKHCKFPIVKSTLSYERTGETTSYTSFSDSYTNTSGSVGYSGFNQYNGNDSMLLIRSGSVLSVDTSITSGNINKMGVTIRIINATDDSKYVDKSVEWSANDGNGGSFKKTWQITESDVRAIGGYGFVKFAIQNMIQRNTRGASMYSIVKLTGWKKNVSIFSELTHTTQGMLLDSFTNLSDQDDAQKTSVRPDLNLDNISNYGNPGGQYSTVFDTPIRGDNDHQVNRVQGSITITGMRPATEWGSSPTLKTDVLCYSMNGSLVKTYTAQYGHNTVGVNKTGGNQNRYWWNGAAGNKYMDYEQSFDIGGQTKIYIGVNSNVITKYTRDHHGTSGTTNIQYYGNIVSGSHSQWGDNSDGGTTIGMPGDPGYPNTSSLDALKRSQLYLEVNVLDIPNNNSWKQLYGKTLWTGYGNLSGYVYVKRQGLIATVLVRYNWTGGGWDGRDHYQFAWIHRLGIFTSYPSGNILLLQPSDNGKTFNFDFSLGGYYKVVVRNTASWGLYGTSSNAYGALSSFRMNDICTGNVTYYLPDKINVPTIFNPRNSDCTVMLRGGLKYRVISQAQNLSFDQLGVVNINQNPVDIQYMNTMFYGKDVIMDKDFIISGKRRGYTIDVMGNAPTVTKMASGVPDVEKTQSAVSVFRARKTNTLFTPYQLRPNEEDGMGLITKINLVREFRLDEVPNKHLEIHTKEGEVFKCKLNYVESSKWTQVYTEVGNKHRAYVMLVNSTWLYVLTYHMNVSKIVLNNVVGNTLELLLRDASTKNVTNTYPLLEVPTERSIPVEYDGNVYYVEITGDMPELEDDIEPAVILDDHNEIVGYLK